MDYAEAVAYLSRRERLGIKFGLENIGKLVEDLGHPEQAYRSILIAGTNGKGSTAALLESILRAGGYRTGRYTSPHLIRLEERIMAEGVLISPEELASVVDAVAGSTSRLRRKGQLLTEPTFFEVTTACAFEFFRRKKLEVAILEVGMGGRWDATNVAPACLTVITKIAMDHERFLGSTLEAIAAEKAATIKSGQPVVTGFIETGPLEVIRAEAARQGSPLFETQREIRVQAEQAQEKQRVRLETPRGIYEEIVCPLVGSYQLENLAVAVRAAEVAEQVGLSISSGAVVSGVAGVAWEGRCERVAGEPQLLIDCAHNALGAGALADYLEAQPHRERVLLFGVMDDKNPDQMLELLLPHFQHIVATRPPNRRAVDPETLVALATARGLLGEAEALPERALLRARRLAGTAGEVVVAGSTFVAGEIKRLLEKEREGEKSD
jgi:dihydrofolate synthase/folylpolyglutamate synthase